MSACEQTVKAVYPDAQACWTSRGWRIMADIPGLGMEIICSTDSGHVPESEAWQDAADRLASIDAPRESA